MKRISHSYLRSSMKYFAVILMTAAFMALITPILADTTPGRVSTEKDQNAIGKAGLDKIHLMPPRTIQGPILNIKVTDTGDETWCDVFVTPPIPPGTHPDDVEYVTLSTTDHMLHAQFLMAWFRGKRVIATAYEITTPPGREWGGYETTFYEVKELMLASY